MYIKIVNFYRRKLKYNEYLQRLILINKCVNNYYRFSQLWNSSLPKIIIY